MACSGVNRMNKKNGLSASNKETLVVDVSSSVTALSDKDCDRSLAFLYSLFALKGCPKCGSHTLQSTWKSLTAVLKLNS